jgi:hypothetical protein
MVAQATLNKQANALVTQFIKNYTEKYGKPPVVNRFKQKWAFLDMIEDLGYERAKEVVDYYFRTSKVLHPIEYLIYNYERLNNVMLEREQDKANLAKIAKETEKRVREWEEKLGNQGS